MESVEHDTVYSKNPRLQLGQGQEPGRGNP